METNTQNVTRAVIVGGGLIGVEMAEMLVSRNIPVTLLVMEDGYWRNVLPIEESRLISNHLISYGIDLKLSTQLSEIIEGENGKTGAVITNTGEKIDCEFVGLTVGVSPNIEFLKNSNIKTDGGILVNRFLETNIPDVYAIGDCAEHQNPAINRKAIEQVWYTGRMMGETVAHTICGNRKAYAPGPWFNSAKFFDIEYQTYGYVAADPKEGELDFYWQHNSRNKLVRMVFSETDHRILGVNALGIRMSHKTWDHWLKNSVAVNEVLKNLDLANFDPEFSPHYWQGIIQSFNSKFPHLALKPRKKII